MINAIESIIDLATELDVVTSENQLSELYSEVYDDNKLFGTPYEWQVEFHDRGFNHRERAIIAGNRVGKTRTGAAEVAIHLTGQYPKWWRGKQFTIPTDWIVAAPTAELCRDILQTALVGGMVEGEKKPDGTGWIPADCIIEWGWRQCGVANVMDTCKVRHVSGKTSVVNFKSYEQGAVKFQGVARHGIWLDEEPTDYEIYTESLTRTLDTNGIVLFTRTPLFGMSKIVEHFLDGGRGIYYKNVTWDDAPHLDEQAKLDLLESFPEHERATRAEGTPMMGSGNVYNVPDEMIVCESFPIPRHFRQIAGIDFGIDHPAAGAWLAIDADKDIWYLTDCYKEADQTAAFHSFTINSRGKWIPVAYPHDGLNRDKASGEVLAEQYRKHGVNILGCTARYDDEKGGAQAREPITIEILERMRTGRFKVFRPCSEMFLAEKRLLHRKDNKIVPVNDDIESAVRYAGMMARYARSPVENVVQTKVDYSGYDPIQD